MLQSISLNAVLAAGHLLWFRIGVCGPFFFLFPEGRQIEAASLQDFSSTAVCLIGAAESTSRGPIFIRDWKSRFSIFTFFFSFAKAGII